MATQIKRTFELCKKEGMLVVEEALTVGRNALVTFVTAGYPTLSDTVGLLKAMQDGGSDIIELGRPPPSSSLKETESLMAGLPFTDPLADGPTIQEANDVALANGMNIPKSLAIVKEARNSGVTVPIILMGYYNPLLIYGEERVVGAAKEAGANGFIVVDLPPEEALNFRNHCKGAGYLT
jgi:tryptophan synthase